jgi:hypothetical protein
VKTNELIDALAIDGVMPPAPARALTLALLPALAIALCLFIGFLGFRPNLLAHLGEPRCLFKVLLMGLLAALSGLLILRLFRPNALLRGVLLLLAVPLVLLAVAIGVELAVVPASHWRAQMVGTNSMFCLRTIPFLGFAPLLATLFALRNGAPESPALAGAAAGLFAGAIGAAIYTWNCPDDSPLFVAVWYPVGIALLAALGAALGSQILRW